MSKLFQIDLDRITFPSEVYLLGSIIVVQTNFYRGYFLLCRSAERMTPACVFVALNEGTPITVFNLFQLNSEGGFESLSHKLSWPRLNTKPG